MELAEDKLWTVRTAMVDGSDVYLPKRIGVTSQEALRFAQELQISFGDHMVVFLYPFFVADASGVIMTYPDRCVVIEACEADLWNLCDKGIADAEMFSFVTWDFRFEHDPKDILSLDRRIELMRYARRIYFKTHGQTALAEWSIARECDINKNPAGEAKIVFFQLNTYQY
jgi:hypothetical protein